MLGYGRTFWKAPSKSRGGIYFAKCLHRLVLVLLALVSLLMELQCYETRFRSELSDALWAAGCRFGS